MTNFKKNFGVMAVGLLALMFCCVLIAQSTIAREEGRVTMTDQIEQGTVPLPDTDDITMMKKAMLEPHGSVNDALTDITGAQPFDGDYRAERPTVTTSVMQGGEDIASAAVITPGSLPTTLLGTTLGYADDYADPCGYDGTSPDVVYSYTPIVDEYVNFNMCESSYDTKLWVVEAAGMTVVACNDDGPDCLNYQSQIDVVAMGAGLTYYIVIGGYYYAGDAGDYQLDLALLTLGDDCLAPVPIADAATIEDYPVVVPFDMSAATCGQPDASGLNAGSWYFEFTADRVGMFTFSMCDDGTTENTGWLGLAGGVVCGAGATCYSYTNTPGNECADDGPFVCGTVMLAGWTYKMEIFDWCDGMTGTIEVTWEDLFALNDECVDAEDLGVGDGYHFVHNVQATLSSDFDYTFCDNYQNPYSMTCGDVWYYWEADTDGYVNFDMCLYGESWDSKMFIYRGYSCVGDETIDPFGCSDDGCGHFGDGGFIELECSVGEVFMIRVAGWISGDNEEDASCAAEGGMGTGYMDIYQHATSWRPYNDDCPDAIVGVIPAGGGDYISPANNLDLSSWGSCPDLYNTVDGSIGIAGAFCWMVFDAVSVSECTDMAIDFCGMDEDAPAAQWSNWPQGVNLFTGCPCEGPFVTIPVTGGYWINDCDAIDPIYPEGFRWSRVWEFPGLLPGTYYFASSNWTMGVNAVGGSYTNPYDYNVNFRATSVECEYCAATSNINSCPPVAGASWITDVDFESIHKEGIPYVQGVSDDCHAYEDHTDMVASLYKGISYDMSVLMGKVGTAGVHDSCNAWIDWNQNSGFAPFVSELNEKFDLTRLALTWTITVTVPLDAAEPGEGATGVTMMRVRMASDADGTNVPCGEKVWGEVEDFMVEVTSIECGDFDVDGMVDADDIAFLRDWYFGGTTAPDYWQRADIDGDGMITIADVIALVDAAYFGGDLICL